MRKVTVAKSAAPSPVPGSISETGGESMRRTGSGGGRVPSSLSARKDSPIPKAESSTPSTSRGAPPSSSTTSANITTTTSARTLHQTSPRPTNAHLHKPSTAKASTNSPQRSPRPDPLSSPSDSATSSASSSPVQSRFIRRPKFAPAPKLGLSSSGASDGEDEPAFLPFTSTPNHDPSATLRGDPHDISSRRTPMHKKADVTQVSQTSDSSASSAAPRRRVDVTRGNGKKPGPLSPRRTAELAGRSPGKGREGSEGSPSMGSSFSDLDGEYILSHPFIFVLRVR